MTVCGYKPKFRGQTEKVRFALYSRLSNLDVGFRSGYVCFPFRGGRLARVLGRSAFDPFKRSC
jgi:hypothetical protein